MQPKKIAVIGGGMSAMTAVYTLTQLPDWEKKYDITLYQLGWRLGGKGASGINTEPLGKNSGIPYRIEEHGLHYWFGCYENAFKLIKDCYKDLNRAPSQPLATFEEAFKGHSYIVIQEQLGEEWSHWKFRLPVFPGKVGDGRETPLPVMLRSWMSFLRRQMLRWFEHQRTVLEADKNKEAGILERFTTFSKDIVVRIGTRAAQTGQVGLAEYLLETAFEKFIDQLDNLNPGMLKPLEVFRDFIRNQFGDLIYSHTRTRRLWMTINFSVTVLSGLVKDKVIEKGKLNFDRINQYDYMEWLKHHGADSLILNSPFVRAMYDALFALQHGDVNKPNVEAGTVLRIFGRLAFTCKEHIVWQMQAGMGDTIFAPMYEVLQKKGVKFKFFHRLKNMELSGDGKSIAKLQMGRQVTLKQADTYDPLMMLNGLPCWPSQPRYDFIDDQEAQQLREKKINLESCWTSWQDREEIELVCGKDFDQVILGVSVASLPYVASELVQHSKKWADMVSKIETVETQAFQFWFNGKGENLGAADDLFLSTYADPVDTVAAMNQLLPREKWPSDADPGYIAYLCGVKPCAQSAMPFSMHDYPEQEKEKVKKFAKYYLENYAEHVFPKAMTTISGKKTFNWDLLTDPEHRQGEERLNAQYFRSNIDPSERYVLSVKGSSRYRMRTSETGFDNLFITGDWIFNGFNVGAVEAATVAGKLTAKAISGDPVITILAPPENL